MMMMMVVPLLFTSPSSSSSSSSFLAYCTPSFPCLIIRSERRRRRRRRLPLRRHYCCCSSSLALSNDSKRPGIHATDDSVDLGGGIIMSSDDKQTDALLKLGAPSFQSIRAQIHLVQNLGITAHLLSKLIKKRPALFIPNKQETPTHSLLSFLSHHPTVKGLIHPLQLARLLTATDPKFFSHFEAKVGLLLDIGIPTESLPHVLNNLNLSKALCFKSMEDIQRMLSFLQGFGGVDLILGRPAILNFDLDSQLLPRIQFLLNMSGGDRAATTTVLLKLPFILAYTVDHYTNHVHFFRSSAGLTDEEIFKIILVYPSLFSASRERKLHPRIQFLKRCGFTSNDIYKLLIKAPLFLSLSFQDNLAHKLVLLLKIGYRHGTKELGLAMGWVCRTSCKNMQEVISLFLNYGLTCEEILAMGKKHPQVLQYNHKSMKQKLDYLTQEMGYEVREMLAFPAFLGYGFDARIKHRFEASLGEEGMSINKLFSMSTARFSKKQEKKKKKMHDPIITKTSCC